MADPRADRQALGAQIRLWRQRRQMSQVHLAHRAGITQSTLSNYENGRREPAVSTLKRIAQELDVSLDELTDHQPRQR